MPATDPCPTGCGRGVRLVRGREERSDREHRMIMRAAAKIVRERNDVVDAFCHASLVDPQRRGVLIVRDPATGDETVSLDESVPAGMIHDYPWGRDVAAPHRPATFFRAEESLTSHLCPECVQGKHRNCDGRAWDPETDDFTTCDCGDESHAS